MANRMLLALATFAVGIPAAVACNASPAPAAPASPSPSSSTSTSTPPSSSSSSSSSSSTSTSSSSSSSSSSSPDLRRYAAPIGATFPDPSPATAHISAGACRSLLASAQATLDVARRSASRACKVDTDCVTIHGVACGSDCGSEAIAASAAPAYVAAANAVRNGKCKAWNDGDCPRTTPLPMPSCPAFVPVCKDGTCSAQIP